jgi:hypothetical protein
LQQSSSGPALDAGVRSLLGFVLETALFVLRVLFGAVLSLDGSLGGGFGQRGVSWIGFTVSSIDGTVVGLVALVPVAALLPLMEVEARGDVVTCGLLWPGILRDRLSCSFLLGLRDVARA